MNPNPPNRHPYLPHWTPPSDDIERIDERWHLDQAIRAGLGAAYRGGPPEPPAYYTAAEKRAWMQGYSAVNPARKPHHR